MKGLRNAPEKKSEVEERRDAKWEKQISEEFTCEVFGAWS
jgi:hypothetical protein